MTNIDVDLLRTVTGGAATVAPRKRDDKLEQAVTKLQSHLKELARGKPDPIAQLMPLLVVGLATRR